MAHILIAEDVAEIRFAYEAILMSAGHSVDSVANGKDAIDHLKNASYDIIITDLMMPRQDGFDVTEAAEKLTPRPKILVITGGGDQMSPHAALKLNEANIDRMLVKPVEQKALLDCVDRLLAD